MNGATVVNPEVGAQRQLNNGLAVNNSLPQPPQQNFREWAPLKHLIEKIPPRYHLGFVSKDLILTCVTVSCDSIVVGSSAGVVFWFNRGSQLVSRKSINDKFSPITSLAITISEHGDEILAVGDANGLVAIFSSNGSSQATPVSIIVGQHKAPLAALAWDGSGLRLLSGDESGKVLLSHFHQFTLLPHTEIVIETSCIVQLKFHPLENDLILISSLRRAVIFELSNQSPIQVGQKDRKVPTPYGADFGYAGNETVIYSSRPGLRLWLSDCRGAVQQTLIYKESSVAPHRSKTLMLVSYREDQHLNGDVMTSTANFGPVFCLNSGLIVTYSPTSMFILDPGQLKSDPSITGQVGIVGSCRFAPKFLRMATVFHNEIFLLTENRILMRISDRPDRSSASSVPLERPLLSGWRADITKSVKPSTLQETITKLAQKISTDVDVTKARSIASSVNLIQGPYIMESLSNALAPLFEFKSTPPIQRAAPPKPFQPHFSDTRSPSPSSTSSGRCSPVPMATIAAGENSSPSSNSSQDKFIGSPPFVQRRESPLLSNGLDHHPLTPAEEELVYGSFMGKKRKWKLNRKSSSNLQYQLDEIVAPSKSPEPQPTVIELQENVTWPPSSLTTSPKDNLREELERKDQLLATLLQLDQIMSKSDPIDVDPPHIPEVSCFNEPSPSSTSSPSLIEDKEETLTEELFDNIYSKYASNSPLDQSLETYPEPLFTLSPIPDSPTTVKYERQEDKKIKEEEKEKVDEEEDNVSRWRVCPLDTKRKVTSLAAGKSYVVIIDSEKSVYYQAKESSFQARDWLPVDSPASQVVVAGTKLWRIYKNCVYQGSSVNPHCPFAEQWTVLESGVSFLAVSQLETSCEVEYYLWMVHTDGVLTFRSAACLQNPILIQAPGNVKKLCCLGNQVFLLLHNGGLYSRSRVTDATPAGVGWQRLQVPGEIVTMAENSLLRQLWILTKKHQLFYFLMDANDEDPGSNVRPRWWQVLLPVADLKLNEKHNTKWLNISTVFKRQSSSIDIVLNETRILLAVLGSSFILTAQHLTGYAWNRFGTLEGERWQILNASGLRTTSKGALWLVNTENKLFRHYDNQLEQINLPNGDTVRHLSASSEHLWLVTETGDVFIRTTNSNLSSSWTQLSTLQFQPDSKLRRISLGQDCAWACDDGGRVYFRYGDNGPPTLLSPAWIPLENPNGIKASIKEIYVGPSSGVVWALDKKGKIYVRQGITPEFLIGVSWLPLDSEIQAVQLSISQNAVWMLSTCGSIYYRLLRRASDVGWEKVPGSCTSLSASVDNTLLALDADGCLHRLVKSSPMKCTDNLAHNDAVHVDDDWILL